MFDRTHDTKIRVAAFTWLAEQKAIHGAELPRTLLQQGFPFEGRRVPLVGPQGIFKPAILHQVPLSITTVANGPYNDTFSTDNFLHYRYRGTDPSHRDNVGLRTAMTSRIPLIYFYGVAPGRYLPIWPVFIADDDPSALTFTVTVDEMQYLTLPEQSDIAGFGDYLLTGEDTDTPRRNYITAATRVRLHQRTFRERVLAAYQRQCAFCRLRHEELLDAAHIIPDSHPDGEPVVSNGMALCHLHHAAFDNNFIGVNPDNFVLEVRPDILSESDGPTLRFAIQGLHETPFFTPENKLLRPNRELLRMRYDQFRNSDRTA
ncbi:MAG TPA: HNH endonuclease [Firmicutes bacterium]|jgi:putative restriction endonuclease|nr:HNH endonuclease [Bacillota bacterium]HAW69593.1 HNH endonuclease [Bacillota bacterium]HAZ21770.1 HNH endonuclease [Bacillota bacterium]HBE06217.1 HNH endonuclease [Bacillota bacterium]HBG43581.1 HNH endonuclease [Bacillota bacterium]